MWNLSPQYGTVLKTMKYNLRTLLRLKAEFLLKQNILMTLTIVVSHKSRTSGSRNSIAGGQETGNLYDHLYHRVHTKLYAHQVPVQVHDFMPIS